MSKFIGVCLLSSFLNNVKKIELYYFDTEKEFFANLKILCQEDFQYVEKKLFSGQKVSISSIKFSGEAKSAGKTI